MKITYHLNPLHGNFDHEMNMIVDMSKLFNRTRLGSYTQKGDEIIEVTIESNAETIEEQISMLWKVMKGLLMVRISPFEIDEKITSYGVSVLPKVREKKDIWNQKVLNVDLDYPEDQLEYDNRKYLMYQELENMIHYFSKGE